MRRDGGCLRVADPDGEHVYDLNAYHRVLVVGAGKAGAPMAEAAAAVLGERLSAGAIIVKYGHAAEAGALERVTVFEAGHPVPDAAGVRAAQHLAELLRGATERDLVICLLSGGGSALMPLPVASVSLADLQALTRTLLACGATINEINTLRKHLSQLAGGQMARLAAPATLVSLILSDVVGDPLDVIASGPTVPDPTTYADAWAILERYGVLKQVPAAVLDHLRAGVHGEVEETPKPGDAAFERVQNVVIGSNRIAAHAAADAARQLGYHTLLLSTFVEGEAREVARVVAALAKGVIRGQCTLPPGTTLARPACLVLGGETTVTLHGDGRGGRNQELALAAALALEGWPGVLVTCLATDGTDGPTDAAGAFADGGTVQRAAALGLSAADHLARNDAYPFFADLDDLITTGPTRTNVNDLIIVLVAESPPKGKDTSSETIR
jgi:glycerate 2-kinase